MIDINELRRLTQAATPGPWKMVPVGDGRKKFAVANSEFLSILTVTDEGDATFGTVYDDADAEFIAAANPATISELLDRLEAAEKDLIVKEEVIDSLAAVVKKLDAQCDATEKERDALRSLVVMRFDHDHPPQFTQGYDTHELTEPVTAEHCRWFVDEIERLRAEVAHIKEVEFPRKAQAVADGWRGKCERLEAKIEEMEQQEPIAYMPLVTVAQLESGGSGVVWCPHDRSVSDVPVYALPGAQGEEK